MAMLPAKDGKSVIEVLTQKKADAASFSLVSIREPKTPFAGKYEAKFNAGGKAKALPGRDFSKAPAPVDEGSGKLDDSFADCNASTTGGLTFQTFSLENVYTHVFLTLVAATEQEFFLEDLFFLTTNWTDMDKVAVADFCAWDQCDRVEVRVGEDNGAKYRNVIQNIELQAKINLEKEKKTDNMKALQSLVTKVMKVKDLAARVTWVEKWSQANYDKEFAIYEKKALESTFVAAKEFEPTLYTPAVKDFVDIVSPSPLTTSTYPQVACFVDQAQDDAMKADLKKVLA